MFYGITDLTTFVLGTIFIVLLPGPNSLYVMTVASRWGVAAGYRGACGIFLGDLILMILSATGAASLLQATPALFMGLRYAGAAYLVWLRIGLLRCRAQGGADEWTEYLLYSERQGFLWLVESADSWDRVKVLDTWPESVSASAVRLDGAAYTRMQAYGAEVVYAAGAFNWQVKVGDKVSITDYRGSRGTLTSEQSKSELGWSLAQRVPASTVDGWFGKGGKLAAAAPASPVVLEGPPDRAALRRPAWVFTALVLVSNVPIAVVGGLYSWVLILLAIGVLWLPVLTDWMDD